jgi:phage baseplate assembly protein W
MTFQLQLPITISSQNGFGQIKNLRGTIAQDFSNLLITNPGEKIKDPNYGVGLLTYLFEVDSPAYRDEITIKIQEQVTKYMPFLNITNISFESKEDILYIKVEYYISGTDSSEQVTLPVNTEGA